MGDGGERPILCDRKIFRLGDVVAVFAAETRRQACEAAKLVKVEYEGLPEYHNVFDAAREDAVEIHSGSPTLFIKKPPFKGFVKRLCA
jgi:aldehyde oxidoreductase